MSKFRNVEDQHARNIWIRDRNWLQCGLSVISVALANAKERLGDEAPRKDAMVRAQTGT